MVPTTIIELSNLEKAYLANKEQFSKTKQRYLRYRIRKKPLRRDAAAASRDGMHTTSVGIPNDIQLMRAIKMKADPPSFDLGICGSEDRRDILTTLRAQQAC